MYSWALGIARTHWLNVLTMSPISTLCTRFLFSTCRTLFYNLADITPIFCILQVQLIEREKTLLVSRSEIPGKDSLTLFLKWQYLTHFLQLEVKGWGWFVRICQLPPGWLQYGQREVVPRRKGKVWAVGLRVLN